MERNRRSAREVAEELRKLIQQPDTDRDRAALLHEVQVYQEELTVQNEALRDMQTALEETRDRFIELYDFAPNGYVTLDPHGIIQQINLTGAAWLGKSKQALEGMPLLGFIESGDRNGWMGYLRRCRDYKVGKPVSVQLRLRGTDGHRVIELLCKPRQQSSREYFTSMIDVTEHLQLQTEREEAAHARAALAGRLISIQEDERIRIARDLHDNLGQQLTGLRLRLEAIALSESVDANVSRHVHEAQVLIDKVDRGLDFIAAELRPASLDIDFVYALREFVQEWSITFGIEATFHASPMPDIHLGEDTQTHLYRITQEALNNVYRHAHARRVSVILERRRDSLVLLIEDDGKGFEYTGKERRGRHGLGLVGMRERAALIGGKLEVESAPGKGTTVFVTVTGAFDPGQNKPAALNR
jgi:PAS domain S-box-containing protein